VLNKHNTVFATKRSTICNRSYLDPPESLTQTASRSLYPFFIRISPNFLNILTLEVLGPWTALSCVMYFRYVDDVMFWYKKGNKPEWKTTCMFCPVRQVAAPVDVIQRCLVEVVRWRHRRRSLPSTTAFCCICSTINAKSLKITH